MGQPFPMAVTVSAHVEQNLECPHGTSATPARGDKRQTIHKSSAAARSVLSAPAGAVVIDAEAAVDALGKVCWSSWLSLSSLPGRTWRASVCAPRLWLTA